MTTIKSYKRRARAAARANRTSHQSELNAIAREHGHPNWGAFQAGLAKTELDNQSFREKMLALIERSKTLSALSNLAPLLDIENTFPTLTVQGRSLGSGWASSPWAYQNVDHLIDQHAEARRVHGPIYTLHYDNEISEAQHKRN